MIRTATAIIEKEGKFLLIKRFNTPVFGGYWALSGGKVDGGEDTRETIKREVKEETNLNFNPIYFRRYKEDFPKYGWEADVDVFYGDFSGNVEINEEASEFGWFSIDDINDMKIAFHHRRIIRDFINSKN